MNIRLVKQRKKNDCGIACVAMLTNRIYKDVVATCGLADREDLPAHDRDLRRWFKLLGHAMGPEQRATDWNEVSELDESVLVAVNLTTRDEESSWHWVVVDPSGSAPKMFDPLKGERKLDKRTNVYSYFKVPERSAL